jgi:predicted aspartyl protease
MLFVEKIPVKLVSLSVYHKNLLILLIEWPLCPLQRRNKQTKPNVSIIDEAGMYIDVCIGGVSANFLVDTGATLSIVSTSFYDKLTKKPILQEFTTAFI